MNRVVAFGLAIFFGVAAVVGFSSLFTVNETEQAIVLQFGAPVEVIEKPGLHVKTPFVQNVIYIDKRILDLDIEPQEVIALDQKRLVVDAFARFRIVNALTFYQAVGSELVARSRLKTILVASMRRVLGEAPLLDVVVERRSELMERIQRQMNLEAEKFGIDVVDVRIRRADLPEANSNAIFSRMRTERQQEAAEYRAQGRKTAQEITAAADRTVTVTLAEANRKSEIIRGEGDACRNRIFAATFGLDPDFFAFYRSMQSYDSALASSGTTAVLSPDSEFFRYFEDPNRTASKLTGGPRSSSREAAALLEKLKDDVTLRSLLCADLVSSMEVPEEPVLPEPEPILEAPVEPVVPESNGGDDAQAPATEEEAAAPTEL